MRGQSDRHGDIGTVGTKEAEERAMNDYYASGIRSVEIAGDIVDMERLVAAWQSRGDVDKVRAECEKRIGAHADSRKDAWRAVTDACKERDAARVERDAALNAIRDRGEYLAALRRDIKERTIERDSLITLVNSLRNTLRESTTANTELIRERDVAVDEHKACPRREEEFKERARATSVFGAMVADPAVDGDASMCLSEEPSGYSWWLVNRTDVAGKPGEYGRAIVWAESADEAVDGVLTGGHNGGPMYGYRDADHTFAVPLDEIGKTVGEEVLISETLR